MMKTILASDYAKLDSDVYTGGGTDDTAALQAILDKAPEWGGLRLIMDGAALVKGLKLHSNTTIECMNKCCGFYLADNSDCAVITNYNWNYKQIETKNISLIGGTYNHNCLNQAHDVETDEVTFIGDSKQEAKKRHYTVSVEFYGIENLNVRDLTVRDQRTFAFTVGCFKNVNVENTYVELINEIPWGNQDGFHFWGPGQYLTMRNIGGKTEDDFMNIGPDERDGVSDITDVLVDGVMLKDAWQGIRLLSRGTGRLDRVTIRNVTGTYHSLGFYINPWFIDEKMGNFGSITFENINLKPLRHVLADLGYENPPFLFSIGGDIENLTFKNIACHHPSDNRELFQIGYPYHKVDIPFLKTPRIQSLTIDGLQTTESDEKSKDIKYLRVRGIVERLNLRDIDIIRPDGQNDNANLIKTMPDAEIKRLVLDRAIIENMPTVLDLTEGKTDLVIINDVITENVDELIVGKPEKVIGKETKI